MVATFEWPLPPYFAAMPGDEGKHRPGWLGLPRLGGRLAGHLSVFTGAGYSLCIRADGEKADRTYPLDQVKCVRLLRPLLIRRHESPLETRAVALFAPSERQSYQVEFPGNELIVGETVGHVNSVQGLFLFVPTKDGGVTRFFYPRAAMVNYRIGPPIGELLVGEAALSREAVDAAIAKQRELRTKRIGDHLHESLVVSREQLDRAIKHQEAMPVLRLGEALIQLGIINQEQLDTALARQRQDRSIPLGQILTSMGLVDEDTLRNALARKLGIPFLGLAGFNFDPEALRLIAANDARKRHVMPLCLHDDALVVAFEDPLDAGALEGVRFLAQRRIIPAMASREEITRAITDQYGKYGSRALPEFEVDSGGRGEYEFHRAADVDIDRLASQLVLEDKGLAIADETAADSDSVLVQLVNKMILDAWTDGVSDIHVETYSGKKSTRVRFRKDGTLVDYTEIPSGSRKAVVSRIKVMAHLDISERRKSQDGKIDFRQFGPADVELRVVTVPTSNGLEDVVMRVLSASKPVAIDHLGIAPDMLVHLKRLMDKPYGLILACGPTGSGKTTTLHSLLGSINTTGRKIWTAEDPIEITQPGLRQVQMNAKIGWTFAAAMRTFLRADPDVIMVGEMRDAETARAGVEASLTGHLVLSTLHTNSAPESVVRLLDLGIDPFNFADALLAVLAQRLARSLCPLCRQKYAPEAAELEELAREYCDGTGASTEATLARWRDEHAATGGIALFRAAGCAHCEGSGYHGRVGIHELLVMTPALRHLVQTRAPVNELVKAAIAGGMRTLKQDGIEKILAGRTDIGKVRAVCT